MRLEKLFKVLVVGGATLTVPWVACTQDEAPEIPDGVADGGGTDEAAPDGATAPDVAAIPDLEPAEAGPDGVGSWLSWV